MKVAFKISENIETVYSNITALVEKSGYICIYRDEFVVDKINKKDIIKIKVKLESE